MSCRPLTVNAQGQITGWLCGGGTQSDITKRARRLWCFNCRKRTLHRKILFQPDSDYYDPGWEWKCPTCKGNYTTFPGCEP